MPKCVTCIFALMFIVIGVLFVYEPQHAPAASAAATVPLGTIAYVVPNDTTGDQIWLIEPNGTNSRQIYSTGQADPYHVQGISTLAWRPDSGELVFASDHEEYCSWYASDLYAIQPDGSGYRRVTNSPACAGLASYPKGTVSVGAGYGYQVYVMGAPMLKFSSGGTVTFDDVADLGSTVQPVVAIQGNYRWMGPAVDVVANRPVDAGSISGWGTDEIGAYKPSWRSDGSRIGYAFGCAQLYGVADHPAAGNWGQKILSASGVSPCIMAYGPTPGTANQIVYYTDTGVRGIYRTTENSSSAGTLLVSLTEYDRVLDIEYLPDGSGIAYTVTGNWGDASNVYRYDFNSGTRTRLTNFTTEEYARDLAISPDGQTIIFERATHDWTSLYGGPSDLWAIGTDGSNLHLFKSSAAHPTWSRGAVPVPLKVFLPFIKR